MTAYPIYQRRPDQGVVAAIRRVEGHDMQAAWRDHVALHIMTEAERLAGCRALAGRMAEVPPAAAREADRISRRAEAIAAMRRARNTALACVVAFCTGTGVMVIALQIARAAGWW